MSTIVQTPDSTKAHFIARLKGDGSKKPVLLAAHADVVGVEREKWTVDPFAGEIKDGHVWGRGAIDFKGGMAVFARAVMMLAEQKVPLSRDVIFLAEADEEGGLPYSASWLAREHWADIDAEFALNEGGWIMKGDGWTSPLREHFDRRQELGSADADVARHVDAFIDAAAGQRDLLAVARDGEAVDVRNAAGDHAGDEAVLHGVVTHERGADVGLLSRSSSATIRREHAAPIPW